MLYAVGNFAHGTDIFAMGQRSCILARCRDPTAYAGKVGTLNLNLTDVRGQSSQTRSQCFLPRYYGTLVERECRASESVGSGSRQATRRRPTNNHG
jgi:hypothetical protein